MACDYPSKRSENNTMMKMPEELVVEMLKRLAAKRLGQIRSVCKAWNSLIPSAFFIAQHHQHHQSSSSGDEKSYLLLRRGLTCNSYAFYHNPPPPPPLYHQIQIQSADDQIQIQSPDNQIEIQIQSSEDQEAEVVSMAFRTLRFQCFPFIRGLQNHNNLTFMDVIHGVICLTSSSSGPNSPVLLWNPRIHKHVEIPFPFDSNLQKNHNAPPPPPCLGFGFNTLNKDFMVMRLWMSMSKSRPLVYELFSPKQHVWRKGVAPHIRPGNVVTKASFFINGTIHWIVSCCKLQKNQQQQQICRLLMFDCQREEFTTMKLPRAFNLLFRRNKLIVPRIFNYRGRLSVVISSFLKTNVWVMEDYGVSTSWKRLTHFNKESLIQLVSEESLFLMDAVSVQQPSINISISINIT